nr:polyadenylate-binding protein RBP45 [Tanacetum cinerariifolium]
MPNVEQVFRLNWASFGGGEKKQDDTPDYTLFVGDLAADVTDYTLQETFSAHYTSVKGAKVVSAKVIRNKQSQQSEGYGFIEFVNRAAAERHLQAYNSTLMPNVEQVFRLNWASFGGGEKKQDDTPDYTVFVGDLAADVTDYTLQETFSAHYTSV